jgi:formate hydrogenlyase subunit 3/multisubunit Na+/H+ antiporter MnhD subunit
VIARVAMIAAPGLGALGVWAATRGGLELPWLLLGTELRADGTAVVFLVLAAVVWTAAALAAGPTLRDPVVPARRLITYSAVALMGNLGLPVAQDAVSFFTFFSVMSLAAYGLVAARTGVVGRRSGRIYIGMAVVAEAVLLAGLVMAVRSAGSIELAQIRATLPAAGERDLIIALLLVGLGVKAGVLGLHMWLPLAYTAAPMPAAAVLAGALTELGLLGWLRVLPLGEAAFPVWGGLLVAVGLGGVLYGVLVGATQASASAVLGYSSIGQIGLMVAGIGVAMAEPGLAPAAVAAVLIFALHHGIVKGTLFIALGVSAAAAARRARRVAFAALGLLALMLAGAPLTSGAAAKDAVKEPAAAWWAGMDPALTVSVVATSILMGRMLFDAADRLRVQETLPGRPAAAGLVLGIAAAAAVPVLADAWWPFAPAAGTYVLTLAAAWGAIWPIALGGAIAVGLERLTRARPGVRPAIPTGDVVVAAEHVGDRAAAIWAALGRDAERLSSRARAEVRRLDAGLVMRLIAGAEVRLAPLGVGALALVVVVLALLAGLVTGGGG